MKKDDQSPDRKTRVKGDRVIHTTNGGVYKGNRYEHPIGLTNEQGEEQRIGAKIDERQVREAAHGERQATEWGDASARQGVPGERGARSDELTAEPFGRKGGKQGR